MGDLRRGAQGIVVHELAEGEELVPVVLLVVTVDLDILFQGLVSARVHHGYTAGTLF